MHKDDVTVSASHRAAGGSRARPSARDNTRLGQLDEFIGFHLRLAQDASFRTFARHTGVRGLKPGRFAAMMIIRNNPGITQAALSRAIARDKSSVTPLIQELDRTGLVKRRQSRGDRRSLSLTLTRQGEMVLRRMLVHAEAHDRRLDEIVGPDKRKLLRLLKKIVGRLS